MSLCNDWHCNTSRKNQQYKEKKKRKEKKLQLKQNQLLNESQSLMSSVENEIWKELLDKNNLMFIFLLQILFFNLYKLMSTQKLKKRPLRHLSRSDISLWYLKTASYPISHHSELSKTHMDWIYMYMFTSPENLLPHEKKWNFILLPGEGWWVVGSREFYLKCVFYLEHMRGKQAIFMVKNRLCRRSESSLRYDSWQRR